MKRHLVLSNKKGKFNKQLLKAYHEIDAMERRDEIFEYEIMERIKRIEKLIK